MTADAEAAAHDCGAEAAPYALGALEPGEAEVFARHMATCAVCRDEVAAFEGIVGALPLAAAQMPAPRRLKRSLISSVHAEPKATQPSTGRMRSRRLRSALARLMPAAAAALALTAAAIAAIELSSKGASNTQPRVRVIQASVATPTAKAVLLVNAVGAELVLTHFPAPPTGKVYEVWLKRNGQAPMPTDALFSVTSAGSGVVDVPGDLQRIDQVLVTPERLGGSLRPTHAPVIVAQVG